MLRSMELVQPVLESSTGEMGAGGMICGTPTEGSTAGGSRGPGRHGTAEAATTAGSDPGREGHRGAAPVWKLAWCQVRAPSHASVRPPRA